VLYPAATTAAFSRERQPAAAAGDSVKGYEQDGAKTAAFTMETRSILYVVNTMTLFGFVEKKLQNF